MVSALEHLLKPNIATYDTYLRGRPHIVGDDSISMVAATGLCRGVVSLDDEGSSGLSRGLIRGVCGTE